MEFIGTGIIVLTAQLAIAGGKDDAGLAISYIIVSMIYSGASVSGSHFNPAVSFSLYLRGSFPPGEVVLYSASQILGGLFGAVLGGVIGGKFVAPTIGSNHNFLQAFLAEFVFTAILILVVLTVVPKSGEKNGYFGSK